MSELVQTAMTQLQEAIRQAEKEIEELKTALREKKTRTRAWRRALATLTGVRGAKKGARP